MTIIGGLIATTIKNVLHRRSSFMNHKTLIGRRCISSKVARWDDDDDSNKHEAVVMQSFRNNIKVQLMQQEDRQRIEGSCWIPDPRTGIYYPKGHEWVMKDVPDGAATFTYNYWFRNTEL
uniref:uncharacterized protein LOC122594953 n=1 Tax=Erigeron canadensis TaxID=72917 RepID=UPI001CB8F23A|nr:uncharacterized protein LOC122594953 [Erigeron canadensis]